MNHKIYICCTCEACFLLGGEKVGTQKGVFLVLGVIPRPSYIVAASDSGVSTRLVRSHINHIPARLQAQVTQT